MPFATASRSARPRAADWRVTLPQAIAALIALAAGAGGTLALVVHARALGPEHVLAPAGLLLILASAVQVRLLVTWWRCGRLAVLCAPLVTTTFWRRLFVVGSLAYLGALWIGPVRYIGCAWLAAMAICYTLLLWPLGTRLRVLATWRRWSQSRIGHQVALVMSCSMVLVVCSEGGLRIHRVLGQQGWYPASKRSESLPNSKESNDAGLQATAKGNVDRMRPGRFRVAVAAGQQSLDEVRNGGCLARVQQMFPGLDVIPVALAQPWSNQSADELAAWLSAAKVDLLLVVMPVCENLPRAECEKSWFDWRSFALTEALLGPHAMATATEPVASRSGGCDDFESFLDLLGPQLAACRAPQDEAMRLQWQQTFESLDFVLADCRARRLPVALVLVPGQFQVNAMLGETLARRHGYAPGQLDLELPQRKWAGFAEPRKVPLVDLLPALRLCRQSVYERNAQSWNETGNAAAAAAIGGWLESRYGRQLSVPAQLTSAP